MTRPAEHGPPPDPTEELFRAIRAYVGRYLPHRLPRRVVIRLDDGEQVALPVPVGPPQAPPPCTG